MANPRSNPDERPRLLYVVTSPTSVRLLRGQLRYMAAAGFDVTIASSPGPELDAAAEQDGVRTVAIPMACGLSPLRDLKSLRALRRLMREGRPHITNVSTTKAGLVGGLAARSAGVPIRVYVLGGIRYQAIGGIRGVLLKIAERIACGSAHRRICVSESVRKRLELDGLLTAESSCVLASGSSNGVDAPRFAPMGDRAAHAKRLRHELDIPAEAPVVGFVGRCTREAGLPDLLAAHEMLKKTVTGARLLVVGGNEAGDALPAEVRERMRTDRTIVCTGSVEDPAPYYHVMDVLALPSHGEGFLDAALEAYAAGKPVVATRAIGVIDAVMEEGTGLLVPVGDAHALAEALDRMLKSPETRREMGAAGRRWVERDFRPVRIWREMEKEYRRLLEARGLPLPVREPVTTGFLEANA